MYHLTLSIMAAILTRLLPHVAVGIKTPNKAATGHFLQWFFCTHQKLNSILLWWDVLSCPLNDRPRLGGSLNLIHPTAQRLRPMGGGLPLLQGLSA